MECLRGALDREEDSSADGLRHAGHIDDLQVAVAADNLKDCCAASTRKSRPTPSTVLCIVMGAGFFCLAGSAAASWRRYVYVPRGRRLANSGWPDRSEEALRRSLPPNSSVVFQAAVGILAVVITAVNL